MSLPNKLTLVRLALSPVLFVIFFVPLWTGSFEALSVPFFWAVFLAIEISDILDGHFARKWDLISDVGKVLDPFADVISRLTYFICFAGVGVLPLWILTIFIYREVGVTFLRLLMYRKGVAMAASMWGKLKAVTYAVSGVVGFIIVSCTRLSLFSNWMHLFRIAAIAIFMLAAAASIGSFMTYFLVAWKSERAPR